MIKNSRINLLLRRFVAFLVDFFLVALLIATPIAVMRFFFFNDAQDLWIPSLLDNVFSLVFILAAPFERYARPTPGKQWLGLVVTKPAAGPYQDLFRILLRNFLKYLPWVFFSMANLIPLSTYLTQTPQGGLALQYFVAPLELQRPVNFFFLGLSLSTGIIYILSFFLQGKTIYDLLSGMDVVAAPEKPA